MERLSVKLGLLSADIRRNSRLLYIKKADKAEFFKQVPDRAFVVCLKREGASVCDSPQERFVAVQTSDEDDVDEVDFDCLTLNDSGRCDVSDVSSQNQPSKLSNNPTQNIKLYCHPDFMKYHHLTVEDALTCRYVCPPDLLRVTVRALTERAFHWANSYFFSAGLLVAICQKHQILVERGSLLLIPHGVVFEKRPKFDTSVCSELLVEDTEPFVIGLLSVKTQIVILRGTDNEIENKSLITAPSPIERDPSSTPKTYLVSDFAVPKTSLFIPRTFNQPVIDFINSKCLRIQRDWNVLPCDVITDITSTRITSALDKDHMMYITKGTAALYGVFHESLAEIQLTCQEELQVEQGLLKKPKEASKSGRSMPSSRTRVTYVKVLPQNEKWKTDQVYLSPGLLHNLKREQRLLFSNASQVNLLKFRKFEPEKKAISSMSASWSASMKHAGEVFVSCVWSPQYSAAASYTDALQEYFITPRLFKAGDVFAVDTKGHIESMQLVDSVNCQPTVFFKIKRIGLNQDPSKDQTFLIDTEHSTLYQEEACHSFIPSGLTDHVLPSRGDKMNPVLPSAGLSLPKVLIKYVDEIGSVLKPYVQNWNTDTETVPSVLLHGFPGSGKTSVAKAVASSLNMHYMEVNCHELCGESSTTTEARIHQSVRKVAMFAPCVLLLRNVEALGKDRDNTSEDPRVAGFFQKAIQTFCRDDKLEWPMVTIAMTSQIKQLTPDMQSAFLYTFEIGALDEAARRDVMLSLLKHVEYSRNVSVQRVAQRTAGFVLSDLRMLISQVKQKAYQRIAEICRLDPCVESSLDQDLMLCGPLLQQQDFDEALDFVQSAHSDAIGAPKIPSVRWEDVGGLSKVKAEILDTIQLPLSHPELFMTGLRRSGVLLYGPPGTGKTLLAKAVATECSLNFLSVKGPELINMYVGQSEENVREVFARARNASPCVIFFDELDSLAPNRGRSGDSGGVMDRVVSQLLAELDGMHKSCDVFVIGATNRPDLLDPALLRPGRFDKLLYLGVSEDRKSQLNIVKALTRKFHFAEDVSLKDVVARCPYNLTGADFYAMCSDALLNALKRSIEQLEAGFVAVDDDVVRVSQADLCLSVERLVPSVSVEELQRYKQLERSLTSSVTKATSS